MTTVAGLPQTELETLAARLRSCTCRKSTPCFNFPGIHLTVGISVLWPFFPPEFLCRSSDAIAWSSYSRLCARHSAGSAARKGFHKSAEKLPGKPQAHGLQVPLPLCSVYFSSVHLFAPTYIYLKGTSGWGGDALSKGGSLIRAAVCSEAAARGRLQPAVTGRLFSLQGHGQQEEGNCPAGKLASNTKLGLRDEEDSVERKV